MSKCRLRVFKIFLGAVSSDFRSRSFPLTSKSDLAFVPSITAVIPGGESSSSSSLSALFDLVPIDLSGYVSLTSFLIAVPADVGKNQM